MNRLYNIHNSYIIGLIVILSILIYGQSISFDYALDDAIVIYENSFTTQGISGIKGILSYDSFFGFFQDESKANLVSGGRYRPLSMVLFAMEYELVGNNPWLSHMINILWYIFNGILIFFVTKKIAQNKFAKNAHIIAFMVSLWFISHPLHVEAVANIKGRDEIMAMSLSLAAILLLLRQIYSFSNVQFIFILILSFGAAMSKENALFLLSISPIFVMSSSSKTILQSIKLSVPVIIGLFAYLLLRFSILGFNINSESGELMNNPFLIYDNGQLVQMDVMQKSAAIIYGLGYYLKLFILPYPLSHDYYPRVFPILNLFSWQIIITILIYSALIFAMFKSWKTNKLISLGLVIFLWCMVPVSNILFPIGTHISERFLYIPSFGLILAIVSIALKGPKTKTKISLIIILIIFLLNSVLSFMRTPVWKSNETLFLTDVQTQPQSAKLQNAAGGILTSKSTNTDNETLAQQFASQAHRHLEKAKEIHPLYKSPYIINGIALIQLKEYDKAIQDLSHVHKLYPQDLDAFEKLIYAYRAAGRYHGEQQGNIDLALSYLLQAHDLKPTDYETNRLLGVAYGVNNEPLKAIKFFKKNLQQKPLDAVTYKNIGISFMRLKMQDSAQIYLNRAQEIDPKILNN